MDQYGEPIHRICMEFSLIFESPIITDVSFSIKGIYPVKISDTLPTEKVPPSVMTYGLM